ncbi:hypothetical protein NEOLI_001522 [Neolecta irregularis DAH-3]|uniref:Uncharacterized protein n=1 Tax=Neolecta irregularis (strain DAH-3) TaxID=1198029 RepID=A0A1U7LLK2_NEOID|nr:hypothetical protein NEOLI_001522 [Neolecta irregularis DAH-3]|eukprot:OLL23534.1 hypothetical protein NEOLI_001522 [Neolecta irregularis DAH-3]
MISVPSVSLSSMSDTYSLRLSAMYDRRDCPEAIRERKMEEGYYHPRALRSLSLGSKADQPPVPKLQIDGRILKKLGFVCCDLLGL